MVKILSVDWMAQSYLKSEPNNALQPMENMPTLGRPHVPCMVQPRQPTSYNKVYLQPKPNSTKMASTEKSNPNFSLESSVHQTMCSSPTLTENNGYSSGYESEAASSECPSLEDGSDGERNGAQRRMRTKFTPEQIHKLEKIFNKHKYLDAGERVKTALKLNLSETQVRTWFQNRRMKLKREVQDLRADYLTPTLSPMVFPRISPFQNHGFAGQQLPYSATANHTLYHSMVPQMPMPHMFSHQPQAIMSNPHYF
ncbi:homeobox protein vent1-like [Osmerus eperlanus]|uniref:homeobox protein vent1-like n=1 Tax=Osmerus eperlanus TaxID=29151 RepID=UPI002E0EA28B